MLTPFFCLWHTGDPIPSVNWYKDDSRVEPENDTRITIDCDPDTDLHILLIEDAEPSDAGEYMALAANEHGSFRFRITVIVADQQDAPPPPQRKILKTITTKRTVSVVEETLVDGQVVERTVVQEVTEENPSEVVEGMEEASIHIQDITRLAESTPQSVTSPEPKVNHLEAADGEEGSPPTFIEPPEPVYVDIGEDIKLSCRVKGQKA